MAAGKRPKAKGRANFQISRKRLNNFRFKRYIFIQAPLSGSANSLLPWPGFIRYRDFAVSRSTPKNPRPLKKGVRVTKLCRLLAGTKTQPRQALARPRKKGVRVS